MNEQEDELFAHCLGFHAILFFLLISILSTSGTSYMFLLLRDGDEDKGCWVNPARQSNVGLAGRLWLGSPRRFDTIFIFCFFSIVYWDRGYSAEEAGGIGRMLLYLSAVCAQIFYGN